MLPDVDADDGDVREERVLVRRSGDLEALSSRVQPLHATNPSITPAHTKNEYNGE